MESQSIDSCRLCKPTSLQIWEVYWEIPEVRQGGAGSAVPQVWFLLMVNFGRCRWIQILCFTISILTGSHAPVALITSRSVSDVVSVGRQAPLEVPVAPYVTGSWHITFLLLQDILRGNEYETFYGWISRITALGEESFLSDSHAMEISHQCPSKALCQECNGLYHQLDGFVSWYQGK